MSKIKTIADRSSSPALVLYEDPAQGRPRAGRFSEPQSEVAKRAAAAMQLKTLTVKTPEQAAAVAQLPSGRLYSNNKSFLPFVRRDVFAKVLEAFALTPTRVATKTVTHRAAGRKDDVIKASAERPKVTGYPKNWDSIEPGHLVIAQVTLEDGWWEAVVVEREDDVLTLRYRDYPDEPSFRRHRTTVALINPEL